MRNEDYDRELLICIMLICAALTAVPVPLQRINDAAGNSGAQTSVRVKNLQSVRVVGAPFVHNANPRVR